MTADWYLMRATGIAALVVTSLLRHRLPYRLCRGIHRAAYAIWPLALVHELGAGSDRGTAWLQIVDVTCVVAVGAALAWRVLALEEPEPAADDIRRDRVAA
jgi:hypothetical protein